MSMTSLQSQARTTIMQRDWKPLYMIMATLALIMLQLCLGTSPAFAALVALFCLLTYYTVRAAGGVMSLMGAAIFFLAAQNVLISQFAKVYFRQSADSFLLQPMTTMGVYDAGMSGIYVAVILFRRSSFSRRPPLFAPEINKTRLMWIAYISTVFYVLQVITLRLTGVDAETGGQNVGGLFGLLNTMPFLFALAAASNTAYAIVASNGLRSISLTSCIPFATILVSGVYGANREVAPDAVAMYYLTCFAFRFRFRPVHLLVLLVGAYVAQFIFFPYALYARNIVRTRDTQKNIQVAADTLFDVISNPVKYQQMEYKAPKHSAFKFYYYGKTFPTLDRFSQISIADAIVDAAVRQSNSEMDTIIPGFLDLPPRFLFPDKPTVSANSAIAHREPGIVNKKDKGTGISMGFFCDAYGSFSWPGAFLLPFLIMFLLLCSYSLIISFRLWQNLYALCFILTLPHTFSEQNIENQIVLIIQTPIIFAIVLYLILFLVSFAMRTQVRIHEARQGAARIGRARLTGRRLSSP